MRRKRITTSAISHAANIFTSNTTTGAASIFLPSDQSSEHSGGKVKLNGWLKTVPASAKRSPTHRYYKNFSNEISRSTYDVAPIHWLLPLTRALFCVPGYTNTSNITGKEKKQVNKKHSSNTAKSTRKNVSCFSLDAISLMPFVFQQGNGIFLLHAEPIVGCCVLARERGVFQMEVEPGL